VRLRIAVLAAQPLHLGELDVRPREGVGGAPGLQLDERREPRLRRVQPVAGRLGLGDEQLEPREGEAAAVEQRVRVDRQQLVQRARGVAGRDVDQREQGAR